MDQTTEAIKTHKVYLYLQSWKFFMSTEERKSTIRVNKVTSHVINLVPSGSSQFRFRGHNSSMV